MTQLVTTISELREIVKKIHYEKKMVGLVPTMGALHAGHTSLIDKAVSMTDFVIVSVYVNPTQFGEKEDFSKYPRTLKNDVKTCSEHKVDIVFAPNTCEMYGADELNRDSFSNNCLTYVVPPYYRVDTLCGKSRVGHFDGVATVVTKLFNITQCDYAFFGQKDAQQVTILEKMVKDLNMPLKIIRCPIVRENSGLALSSRNAYLSENGREKAICLSKILNNAKNLYDKDINDFEQIFETALTMLPKDVELEYFECVDAKTLEKKDKISDNTLLAIAARIEGVRLIDNLFLA